ncbi:MAG: hypothetical protein IT561_23005 [Alphaproteobacteria bacterium]|nr:hypothetical protein [Alphaproteobacteria bacterium]
MIRLLEHEGKALLGRRGFAIPEGALFPGLPPTGPWVVKAQVPVGGRGKAGGIRFAATTDEVRAAADAVARLVIGGHDVRAVYVERRVPPGREVYLAAHVDRDLGCPVMLACPAGGVDIEAVPHERIARVAVDPLAGLGDEDAAMLARALSPDGPPPPALRRAVADLYRTLVEEDAELVEINPLIVGADGTVTAADARLILDEDAAFRHPGRRAIPEGTAFEEEARRRGVIGIELDGDIAAMMNGAGMTMATLDQLVAMGGSVRGLVELHGAMARGPDHLAGVVALMASLRPRVLLFNIYFQFRNLDTVAEGIARAIHAAGPGGLPPVVVRIRGVREAEARRILEPLDCWVTDDFARACARAIELSGRPVLRR